MFEGNWIQDKASCAAMGGTALDKRLATVIIDGPRRAG
jgi:hypothetical protein